MPQSLYQSYHIFFWSFYLKWLRLRSVFREIMWIYFFVCVVHLQPPTQNMPMGPGGMNQSGPPPQPPHGHNMPSEGMVSGGPPAPHMQNQMNGQMPGMCPPPPTLTSLPCLSFLFLLFPQFLSHLGCLATPQNCEGGRSKVL